MSRILSKLRIVADTGIAQDIAAVVVMAVFLVTAIGFSAAASASVSLWRLGQ